MKASTARSPIRRTLGCLAAVLIAVIGAGCSSVPDPDPAPDDSGSSAVTGDPVSPTYDYTAGPDDVLVQITYGGYLPAATSTEFAKEFVLLGDGTAIIHGAMPDIYPPPAIRPLRSTTVTDLQIQGLLADADAAGLLDGELDFGDNPVEGQGPTDVVIDTGNQFAQHVVWALGVSEDASGLTDAQIAAREALAGFIEAAYALADDGERYFATQIEVLHSDADTLGIGPDDEQEPMEWPIETEPSPCALITGAEAAQLNEALEDANAFTPWLLGAGSPRYLTFRPVLPGSIGCGE